MPDRKPLIAGNWKMHLSVAEAVELVRRIAAQTEDAEGVEVLVAPPFTTLYAVREALGDSRIRLGAQNMHWEMSGAYTGEISGKMLQEAGCTYVILGHSERRAIFNETSEMVDLKARAAVSLGLIPIICVGETLEEREAGRTFDVVQAQLEGSLNNFREGEFIPPTTVMAYEPVWAIGTGKTATPSQAQEVHQFIRGWLERTFGTGVSAGLRILYGGSVKPENIAELMAEPDIDGALVGGASLNADSFVRIICYEKL